jgi:hypothetical protein
MFLYILEYTSEIQSQLASGVLVWAVAALVKWKNINFMLYTHKLTTFLFIVYLA